MTHPIQPEPSFRAAQIGEAAKPFFFLRTSSFRTDVLLSVSILLDQGFLVEYELDEFNAHKNTFLR